MSEPRSGLESMFSELEPYIHVLSSGNGAREQHVDFAAGIVENYGFRMEVREIERPNRIEKMKLRVCVEPDVNQKRAYRDYEALEKMLDWFEEIGRIYGSRERVVLSRFLVALYENLPYRDTSLKCGQYARNAVQNTADDLESTFKMQDGPISKVDGSESDTAYEIAVCFVKKLADDDIAHSRAYDELIDFMRKRLKKRKN